MSEVHKGRCLCGKVTFQIETPLTWCANCFCESCRRNCSAPLTTFLGLPDGQWKWTGAPARVYNSSPGVERFFCADCGTPMAYRSKNLADEMNFYLQSLENQNAFNPDRNFFPQEKPEWLDAAAELPASDEV